MPFAFFVATVYLEGADPSSSVHRTKEFFGVLGCADKVSVVHYLKRANCNKQTLHTLFKLANEGI